MFFTLVVFNYALSSRLDKLSPFFNNYCRSKAKKIN